MRDKEEKYDENALKYAYKELDLIRDFKNQARTFLHARFVIFITICAFSFSKIDIVFETNNKLTVILFTILYISLSLIGISTLLTLLEHNISITNYVRHINRIRRYFLSIFPDLAGYITLPITDTTPKFGHYGFSPKTVTFYFKGYNFIIILINSTFLGLIPLLFYQYQVISIDINETKLTNYLFFCLGFFLISIVSHLIFIKNKFQTAEKRFHVLFPE